MLFINLIKDYIICLSRLYGIVQKDKVAEIYNKQNEDEITLTQIEEIIESEQEMLKEHFVYVEGNYFIHETVMAFNEFDLYMAQKAGKPYYIPNKKELLKYKDQFYFEKTKEYRVLKNYVVKELTGGDRSRAEEIVEDVQGLCSVEASPTTIFNEISRHVDFKSEKQVSEIMNLVMSLLNNTRLWSNNGFTPRELFETYEKQHLQPLPDYNMTMSLQNSTDNKIQKVGRNDPCLCGSGKKYKKCCL